MANKPRNKRANKRVYGGVNSYPHHGRTCSHDKARVSHHPVEFMRFELDGERMQLDKWWSIAALIEGTADPEMLDTLAALMAEVWRQESGAGEEMTGPNLIACVRELHERGVLGIGQDGRAYMGEPEYDALGRVVGSKRLTDAFRAEVVEEIRHVYSTENVTDPGDLIRGVVMGDGAVEGAPRFPAETRLGGAA